MVSVNSTGGGVGMELTRVDKVRKVDLWMGAWGGVDGGLEGGSRRRSGGQEPFESLTVCLEQLGGVTTY